MTRQIDRSQRPWFAREKSGSRCGLRPYSRAGWLLTLGFAAAVSGMSLLLVGIGAPSAVQWTAWALLTAALTGAFLLTAWRSSAPIARNGGRRRPRAESGDRVRNLLIPILTALVMLGAAMLGIHI